MEARKVEIDFSDAKIHWNPRWPEYSQLLNGFSSGFPVLEPYFIRVVKKAKALAPVEMHRDIDIFCSQERRHYKQHAKFNKLLEDAGYDVRPVVEDVRADFERWLATKSLKFNLAFTDGFETFGPMLSYFFFEKAPDLMSDWDEPTVWLWMWHLSEEFEHRAVCWELYKELYGGYRSWSYLYRVSMMWFAMIKLFGYGVRAYFRLIAKDREAMTLRENLASRIRFLRVFGRLSSFIFKQLVTLGMRRDYDPRELRIPETVTHFLNDASQRYGLAESA